VKPRSAANTIHRGARGDAGAGESRRRVLERADMEPRKISHRSPGSGFAAGSARAYSRGPNAEEAAVFIEEYLRDLRAARFHPRAIVLYLRQVAARVREDLVSQPSAVRSLWSLAMGFIVVSFLGAAAIALGHDRRLAYELFLRTVLWILPAFTLVTLHVGLLRDRQGYRLSSINVPTALTLLRVAMIPGIVLMLAERRFGIALGLYLAAALSDVLDGWLARRWKQTTRFGTLLDPIVDIVFNLSIAAGLFTAGLMPGWVFALAALRYGSLLAGGAALHLFVGPVRIAPTLFGRMSGVVMSTLVGLLVLLFLTNGDLAARLAPLTEIALGVVFALTLAQAVVLGWYNLRVMTGQAAERGRVVGDVRWDAS
jgi:cardiolipin synthase